MNYEVVKVNDNTYMIDEAVVITDIKVDGENVEYNLKIVDGKYPYDVAKKMCDTFILEAIEYGMNQHTNL